MGMFKRAATSSRGVTFDGGQQQDQALLFRGARRRRDPGGIETDWLRLDLRRLGEWACVLGETTMFRDAGGGWKIWRDQGRVER